MKAWFKRHKSITWLLVFMLVASFDIPFYLIFMPEWIFCRDVSRIEFWLILIPKSLSLYLGLAIANKVKKRL